MYALFVAILDQFGLDYDFSATVLQWITNPQHHWAIIPKIISTLVDSWFNYNHKRLNCLKSSGYMMFCKSDTIRKLSSRLTIRFIWFVHIQSLQDVKIFHSQINQIQNARMWFTTKSRPITFSWKMLVVQAIIQFPCIIL